MSYSEKHKRSTSPILRTTSEDRKAMHSNKDNYIQYLEQQLEKVRVYLIKTATMVHKKYEDRMRCVEEVVQEHEEKFENFVKLIKLLQHFAESQEQENSNIRNHINTTMDQLYNNDLRAIKQQFEQQVFELQQISQREQPIQEFEQTINRKIDVIMEEVRQSVLKVDYQKLDQRVQKLELKPDTQIDTGRFTNQLNDLKIVLDSVIQDQEQLKNTVHKLDIELHRKSAAKAPIRSSGTMESSEYEVMRPVREQQQQSRKKSKSSQSRSESRNARLETIKKKKQESVKELIKKHKQSYNH